MKTPAGRRTPRWLQKIQFVVNPIGYMESSNNRFGDIFNAPISGSYNPLLFVSNPQVIQQILTDDTTQFISAGSVYVKNLIGKDSVVAVEGERHERKRKLLMPSFHGERLKTYGKLIILITEKTLNQLTPNQTFSAHDITQSITLEVIIEVALGIRNQKHAEKLKQLIVLWLQTFSSPWISAAILVPSLRIDFGSWSPWRYFRQLKQQIDELIYDEIKERRQQYDSSCTDVLSLLMEARDETGQAMTDEELHDEILGILYAGHETTGAALAWALYWVHRSNDVREQLLQELDSLGNSKEPTSVLNLPYLSAVCNETLRICPPFPKTITRIAQQSVNLMGYDLSPGTAVAGCIYLTHHREDLYPQPEQFRPERFLNQQFSPHEFMPFGGGNRRCIGEALAMCEMKLVLATILTRYQLALPDNRSVRPKLQGMLLAPSRKIKMIFQGRRLSQSNISHSELSETKKK